MTDARVSALVVVLLVAVQFALVSIAPLLAHAVPTKIVEVLAFVHCLPVLVWLAAERWRLLAEPGFAFEPAAI